MKLAIVSLAMFLFFASTGAHAQQCDDFDVCTQSDMCSGGECTGTPRTGGTCDDGNACTVNDTCNSGTCTGSPAPAGTACGGACGGTCQLGFCLPDIEQNGQPCNDGIACTTNDSCMFGFCFGTLRQCPDSDGNPCTADFCNPETGQCQATTFPPCLPCQTCRRTEGGFACDPAPNGTACEDFEVCTTNTSCVAGECVSGQGGPTPTATEDNLPTPTETEGPPTPTGIVPSPTETQRPPTPTGIVPCAGDCGRDGMVSVDEIITAVNIALGNRDVVDCFAADTNADDQVTVDEIVTAVNNALNGC